MSIVLIGDGILDNYKFLDNPNEDLTANLTKMGFRVENYASDGVRLEDIRKGFLTPNLTGTRKYPYRTSVEDGKCRPLEYLSESSEKKMVVLSVGGNDIKAKKMRLLMGVKNFFQALFTEEFRREFELLIETILSQGHRLVLVSVYLPYLGEKSSYEKFKDKSKKLMSGYNAYITELSEKYQLPVIELSKTLDPYNPRHYSSDQTHMSDLSSAALARCIQYVHSKKPRSRFYYAENCDTKISKSSHS